MKRPLFRSGMLLTALFTVLTLLCFALPARAETVADPKMGDIDADGAVSAADARLVLRAAVELEDLTPEQRIRADADRDGTITAGDARLVLRAAVGLESLEEQSPGEPVWTAVDEQTHQRVIDAAAGETEIKPHEWDEGEIVRPATCAEAGEKHVKCTVCGFEYAVEIPQPDHMPEPIPAVEPTCTQNGLTEGSRCSVCGEILTEQVQIPAVGHTPEILPAVEPTCTEAGLTEGSRCSVCGEILTAQEEIPASGHTPEVLPAVEPTCTEAGLTEGSRCSVCGEILTAQEEIPAPGHTPEILPAVEPTCTEAGLTEGSRCAVCGEILTAQETIPAFGAHQWNDGEVTKEPTETNAGVKTYTCTVCGATRTEKLPIVGLMIPANNQYDIYRSNSFYVKGAMFDGVSRQNMEIGIDGNVVYMLSEFDGVQMAIQIIGKDLYIILPAKKTYYKMDKTLLDMLGMSQEDLIPADSLDFGDLPDLQDADSVSEALYNGKTCTLYRFDLENGYRFVVAMDGEKLLYTESFSPSGNLTEGMYFEDVRAGLPANLKKAGAGNRRILTLTVFMTQMVDLMGG